KRRSPGRPQIGQRKKRALDSRRPRTGLYQSRHTGDLFETVIKQPRVAWAQWISPETLIAQVRSTAPFLEARLPVSEPGRLTMRAEPLSPHRSSAAAVKMPRQIARR